MFHSYEDVTNNSGGLLNSELCSVLIASLLGGNLSCHTYCDKRPSFYATCVSSEGPFHFIALDDKQEVLRAYSYSGSLGVGVV